MSIRDDAIEAAAKAIWDDDVRARFNAERALTAALPVLLAPLRELADDMKTRKTITSDPERAALYRTADRMAAREITVLLNQIEGKS